MTKPSLETGVLLFILAMFLLVVATGCASPPGPGPLAPEPPIVLKDQINWTPVDRQVADCAYNNGWDDARNFILQTWDQRYYAIVEDWCCWVAGNTAARAISIHALNPQRWSDDEYKTNALVTMTRVLRPEEWDGVNKWRPMTAVDLALVLAEAERLWENDCWRVCRESIDTPCVSFPPQAPSIEQLFIGPMQAAPLDYEWTIELRRRAEIPEPRHRNPKPDFEDTP